MNWSQHYISVKHRIFRHQFEQEPQTKQDFCWRYFQVHKKNIVNAKYFWRKFAISGKQVRTKLCLIQKTSFDIKKKITHNKLQGLQNQHSPERLSPHYIIKKKEIILFLKLEKDSKN